MKAGFLTLQEVSGNLELRNYSRQEGMLLNVSLTGCV